MEFILEPIDTGADGTGWGAALHRPDGPGSRLEMRWPSNPRPAPAVLDGLAFALLPAVLRAGGTLRVRGALTRGALRNLTELADAWANWRPRVFHRVSVAADRVLDEPPAAGPEAAVAWSGSLRSTHTLVRHRDALVPGAFPVRAVVRIQGLRLDQDPREIEAARRAIAPEGVELVTVSTNAAAAGLVDTEIGVLPIVAAALHGVGTPGAAGLHGRSWNFAAQLKYPRPGPALPDLFSGDRLSVRADGGAASPPEMVEDVSRHPSLAEAVSDCRVRPAGSPSCGRCSGCTLLALAFLAAGRKPPPSLRRASLARAASFSFRDPVLAADAESTLAHWTGARGPARAALAARAAGSRVRIGFRDNFRWLGSAAGLLPPWPR